MSVPFKYFFFFVFNLFILVSIKCNTKKADVNHAEKELSNQKQEYFYKLNTEIDELEREIESTKHDLRKGLDNSLRAEKDIKKKEEKISYLQQKILELENATRNKWNYLKNEIDSFLHIENESGKK